MRQVRPPWKIYDEYRKADFEFQLYAEGPWTEGRAYWLEVRCNSTDPKTGKRQTVIERCTPIIILSESEADRYVALILDAAGYSKRKKAGKG